MIDESKTPKDLKAEKYVLGCCMEFPETVETVLGEIDDQSFFFSKEHRLVYNCICLLAKRGDDVDIMTVEQELESLGEHADLTGMAYVAVTPALLDTQIGKVKDAFMGRTLSVSSHREHNDVAHLIDDALDDLSSVNSGQAMETGYANIDCFFRLKPGEMVVIGARPSIGKTAIGCNIMTNLAKNYGNVALFSLEMSSKAILQRILTSEAGEPFKASENAIKER